MIFKPTIQFIVNKGPCALDMQILLPSFNCISFSHSIALRSGSKLSSMSLIHTWFHCNLGVQSQIEEFLEIETAHQNGNSGVEGS